MADFVKVTLVQNDSNGTKASLTSGTITPDAQTNCIVVLPAFAGTVDPNPRVSGVTWNAGTPVNFTQITGFETFNEWRTDEQVIGDGWYYHTPVGAQTITVSFTEGARGGFAIVELKEVDGTTPFDLSSIVSLNTTVSPSNLTVVTQSGDFVLNLYAVRDSSNTISITQGPTQVERANYPTRIGGGNVIHPTSGVSTATATGTSTLVGWSDTGGHQQINVAIIVNGTAAPPETHTLPVSLDGAIQRVPTQQAGADAAVQQQGVTRTASLDAAVQAETKDSVLFDAALAYLGLTRDTGLDALLKAVRTGQVGLDASIEGSPIRTTGLDASVISGGEVVTGLDAATHIVRSVLANLDAAIQQENNLRSLGIDAAIVTPDLIRQLGLDAILEAQRVRTVGLDAILEGSPARAVGVDGALVTALLASLGLDAGILASQGVDTGLDAGVAVVPSMLTGLDAVLQRREIRWLGLEAVLVGSFLRAIGFDAGLVTELSIATSMDGAVQGRYMALASLDAAIKGSHQVAPPERTFTIPARARAFTVPERTKQITVPADPRTYPTRH